MLAVFIAVLVVIFVLDAFLVVALRAQVHQTSKQVHQRAARQLAVYDRLIEKKSAQLQQLNQQLSADSSSSDFTAEIGGQEGIIASTVSMPQAVHYRNADFAAEYQSVKNSFLTKPETVLHQLASSKDNGKLWQTLNHLCEQLNFEVRYQLICLPLSLQQQVLQEILDEDGQKLYDAYRDETSKADAAGFYDWLTLRLQQEDKRIVLKAPTMPKTAQAGVTYQEEPDILEGFQVVQQGRLYDYSLEKRELM